MSNISIVSKIKVRFFQNERSVNVRQFDIRLEWRNLSGKCYY